jgi:hypothetical protein
VHVGDKVVFDYVLKNVGTNAVAGGTYSFDLYVDNRRIAFDHTTSTIQPSGTVPYSLVPGSFNWQPTNSGRYRYELIIIGAGKTNRVGGNIDVLH